MKKALPVLAALTVLAPAAADARTCLDAYYECLNNTYKTSGFERLIADVACAGSYYTCVKSAER